jgi:hypothetical protein
MPSFRTILDHSDILTKGTGTHAVIMAVKHIIVKALPLPPYHCTTLKKQASKNTAIISLHLIVLTHMVFKQPSMQQDV